MKPFLILQIRPNDAASDGEFSAFVKHSGLTEDNFVRVRMESKGIPDIDLDDFSGVIIGGGPSNLSDPIEKKSAGQVRFENDLDKLLDEIVKRDFPLLGACYGIGALAHHQGGVISKEKYFEKVGPLFISLTDSADDDELVKDLPKKFIAFGGHKEACQNLPEGAVHLASSEECPIQMIRIKKNVYGLQFHPELDVEGICQRINIYKNAGYFPPEDAEKLKTVSRKETVTVPMMILKRFVDRYRRE